MKKVLCMFTISVITLLLFVGCRDAESVSTVGNENVVEIKKAEISIDQSYGADMVSLDYASDDIIIFHGYFGLFVYNLTDSKVVNSIDLKTIDCAMTQGDNYCEVTVRDDGEIIQLHNRSLDYMYVYSVKENTLIKSDYEPLENPFKSVLTPEAIKDSYYLCSIEAVEFTKDDIGYLVLNDNTIKSLEYIRGNKKVKVFNE